MDPRPPLRLPQQRQPRRPPRVFDPWNAQYEMIAEAAHTVRTELNLLFSDGGELLSDTDSDADFDLDYYIKSRSNNIRPEELENEVLILRSFLDYFYSKRTFPFSNLNTAVDFVSSGATMSLDDFDINSRRLKNRYKKRLWKICRNFQLLENAREQHAFELGNRLWGSMSVEMVMVNQEDQQQDDESMASADETLTIASADETLTLGSADETLTMASVEEERNLETEEHGDDGKKDGDNKGDGKDDGDNKADDKKDGDNKGYGKAIDKGKAVAVDYEGDEKEDGDGKDADNKGNEQEDGVVGECPLLKNEFWFENGVLKLPVVSKEAVKEGLKSFGEDRVKNWEKRWKELEIEELNAFLARVNKIRHYANILKDELQSKTYPHGEAELGR